jgi:hypothetical protein
MFLNGYVALMWFVAKDEALKHFNSAAETWTSGV